MTAYDHWLNLGSDGPKELDEEAWDASIESIADDMEEEYRVCLVSSLYDSSVALKYVLNNCDLPHPLRVDFIKLLNSAWDIRAKVDDEYAARTATYDDPRD